MLHLFKYVKKLDWLLIVCAIGLIVAQVGLDLKIPEYIKVLTEIVQSEGTNMSMVWENGGYMMLCALGSLACAVLCNVIIARVASSFSATLRGELFAHISTFSNAEMNKFSTPSLITRTTNDVVQVQNFMAMGIQMLIKAPVMAIWAICKISKTHIYWTTAVIICVSVIIVSVLTLVAICLPKFKKIQKLTDSLNDVTRENLSGVRVVRAFNAEDYQEEKFEKVNTEITKTHIFTSKIMGLMNPIVTLAMNGLMIAIYWIGVVLMNRITGDINGVIAQRIATFGTMAQFTQYAMQVVMSFMLLIAIFIILPRTIVSGNRIWEVLKTKPSIVNGTDDIVTDKQGEIEFKNVSFGYLDSDENVLDNLNFKVNKGETLAIIGATGSGKSTLVNLIPRFFDVTQGEILVDGVNVKKYKEKDLREKIAMAAQKPALFKGSIKDNVTYGSEIKDDDKIQKSLEIAKADFVGELEKGVDSEVAQGGTNFSGGQKQRLSIARAIYKNSEIIIFDDTFSALDYKTDMQVRKNIKENLNDKTVIIVAQRIGTIMHADNIIVLEDGKIVGMGKHYELLKSCDVYKEIALSQLSKEELSNGKNE